MTLSTIRKRSIILAGHKTSVSLEDEFWTELRAIAHEDRKTLSELIGEIDNGRYNANLSSAIRIYVLARCCARAA